jgi:hypothetical protein
MHLRDVIETRSDIRRKEQGLGFFDRHFMTVPEIARSFEIQFMMSELDKSAGGRSLVYCCSEPSQPWEDSASPLTPDMMTWNIKHWHRLKYKMTCKVAGKAIKVAGEQQLHLLAPSM